MGRSVYRSFTTQENVPVRRRINYLALVPRDVRLCSLAQVVKRETLLAEFDFCPRRAAKKALETKENMIIQASAHMKQNFLTQCHNNLERRRYLFFPLPFHIVQAVKREITKSKPIPLIAPDCSGGFACVLARVCVRNKVFSEPPSTLLEGDVLLVALTPTFTSHCCYQTTLQRGTIQPNTHTHTFYHP